jgi:tRNA modification GTPase
VLNKETIAAVATASGSGGVAIVRLSGPEAATIAAQICRRDQLTPRYAHYVQFYKVSPNTEVTTAPVIDMGLVLYFKAPSSFTGEDVVELHAHGNAIVCEQIIASACALGARRARAGEFSERAFLNGKLQLNQLEAIADLISSNSEQAARSAVLSMQGVFSNEVNALLKKLIFVRTLLEAALDFSDEDIEFADHERIEKELSYTVSRLAEIYKVAAEGARMQLGVTVVLSGAPNVGKSSLLNALCAEERAIVTSIAGTTRDLISVDLDIHGVPITLVDTAGIRNDAGEIEREGIARAETARAQADLILQVLDSNPASESLLLEANNIVVVNKADLLQEQAPRLTNVVYVSATERTGLDQLRSVIAERLDISSDEQQTPFAARQRHLDALQQAQLAIERAMAQLAQAELPELIAEELRLAQQSLGEITGEFTPDDLLDYIFREFCIGK